jgi:hypothetical protein
VWDARELHCEVISWCCFIASTWCGRNVPPTQTLRVRLRPPTLLPCLLSKLDYTSRNMDIAKRNDKLDPVLDISPDGDVVLVVGPRNVRLRIQSQCLRCASKVFGAMFGPTWSEGQGLSKEFPREVRLLEDDADALRTICCVIHHRNNDVPQSLTPIEVLQIAIEADKYDLNVALKYVRVQWLKPRGKPEREDMGYLLAAAFLFDDMDMFVAHALALILHYTGSYLEFLNDKVTGQILPWKTFCM